MRTKGGRRYKQPKTSIHKMRAMRMINGIRYLILTSAIEEEELDLLRHPERRANFVAKHQQLQDDLAGHFPFLEIRGERYASDIAHAIARDIVFYILHGDTPGSSSR